MSPKKTVKKEGSQSRSNKVGSETKKPLARDSSKTDPKKKSFQKEEAANVHPPKSKADPSVQVDIKNAAPSRGKIAHRGKNAQSAAKNASQSSKQMPEAVPSQKSNASSQSVKTESNKVVSNQRKEAAKSVQEKSTQEVSKPLAASLKEAKPKMRVKARKASIVQNRSRKAPKAAFKEVTQRHSSFVESIRSRIETLKKKRKYRRDTPAIFRIGPRRYTPIVFSMEDVDLVIKQSKKKKKQGLPAPAPKPELDVLSQGQVTDTVRELPKFKREPRILGAASAVDILGFNPKEGYTRRSEEEEIQRVPKKLLPFYKQLLKLRDHAEKEINIHKNESIKKSIVEDLGDVQDLNDGNTEMLNRDMSLAMVSSHQEMLYEIEEAIKRILNNRYGVCEITQKNINKDRLMAVPFTRYSLEGQRQIEEIQSRMRQEKRSSGMLFSESSEEDIHYRRSVDDMDSD